MDLWGAFLMFHMLIRAASERETTAPIVGRPAVVHIDAKPPHGYFVELG